MQEGKLEELRQVLTCLHVDDKLLKINRLLCVFVLLFLATLIGIDLYLLFGRMDVLPVLGSRNEFPIRAATKVSIVELIPTPRNS